MANIIDAPQSQMDRTVRVFDSFYNFDVTISADAYDVVYSYFKNVCVDSDTAKNFTAMLFRIASITKENPMSLLDNIQRNDKLQVNAVMAYYLNSLKSKTTLYGVSTTPIPNEPVQRNVVI